MKNVIIPIVTGLVGTFVGFILGIKYAEKVFESEYLSVMTDDSENAEAPTPEARPITVVDVENSPEFVHAVQRYNDIVDARNSENPIHVISEEEFGDENFWPEYDQLYWVMKVVEDQLLFLDESGDVVDEPQKFLGDTIFHLHDYDPEKAPMVHSINHKIGSKIQIVFEDSAEDYPDMIVSE